MAKKTQEVTAIEAAQQLGIDPGYLYLQLRAGRIAGRKVGRRWLIPVEAVEKRKQLRQGQGDGAADLHR
jgi:excisionase family DNA binding protein